MIFEPLNALILLHRKQAAEQTESGLTIIEAARELPNEGKVIAIGPKVEGVAVGDYLVFGKYAGTDIVIDGVGFLLLRGEDLLGRIKFEEGEGQ